jgi:hypothetical protein
MAKTLDQIYKRIFHYKLNEQNDILLLENLELQIKFLLNAQFSFKRWPELYGLFQYKLLN